MDVISGMSCNAVENTKDGPLIQVSNYQQFINQSIV